MACDLTRVHAVTKREETGKNDKERKREKKDRHAVVLSCSCMRLLFDLCKNREPEAQETEHGI